MPCTDHLTTEPSDQPWSQPSESPAPGTDPPYEPDVELEESTDEPADGSEPEGLVAAAEGRSREGQRVGILGAVAAAVIAAMLIIPGARDTLPVGLPVVGRSADTVFDQLTRAGLPVSHGEPSSGDFRRMVRRNGCNSSRAFVRSDTEGTGWGFICVKPPADAYERISSAFDDMPMLLGPLYVDDGGGDVIVFGFGWPADASETVYNAIDGADGTYLIEQ